MNSKENIPKVPLTSDESGQISEGRGPRAQGIITGSGRFRVPPIFGVNFGPRPKPEIKNTDPADHSQSK